MSARLSFLFPFLFLFASLPAFANSPDKPDPILDPTKANSPQTPDTTDFFPLPDNDQPNLHSSEGSGGDSSTDNGPSVVEPVPVQPSGPLPEPVQPLYTFNSLGSETSINPLSFASAHSVHRTITPKTTTLTALNGKVTDTTLALQTDEREAENDAMLAKYDYENNAAQIPIRQKFYDQDKTLFEQHVISRQQFEETGAVLIKTQSKAAESKSSWAEYQAEADLDKLSLKVAQGENVPLVTLAKGYTHLWDCRLAKYKSLEQGAKADFDYWDHVYQNDKMLNKSQAVSDRDLLEAQSQAEQSEVAWKLAQEMVEQNQHFYQQALDTETQLEQQR